MKPGESAPVFFDFVDLRHVLESVGLDDDDEDGGGSGDVTAAGESLKEMVRARWRLLGCLWGCGVAIAVSVSEMKDLVLGAVDGKEEEYRGRMSAIKGVSVARQLAVRPIVTSTKDQIAGAVADPRGKECKDEIGRNGRQKDRYDGGLTGRIYWRGVVQIDEPDYAGGASTAHIVISAIFKRNIKGRSYSLTSHQAQRRPLDAHS